MTNTFSISFTVCDMFKRTGFFTVSQLENCWAQQMHQNCYAMCKSKGKGKVVPVIN
jgi:hypothetical protein